jgi:hypothetical protein
MQPVAAARLGRVRGQRGLPVAGEDDNSRTALLLGANPDDLRTASEIVPT